jgi:uncharacterized protein YvpB
MPTIPRSLKSTILALLLIAVLGTRPASADVLSIPFFSQLDPRWSNPTICCTVSMAMALAYRGAPVDPAKLIAWLKKNNGYTGSVSFPVNFKIAVNYQGKHWLDYDGQSTLGTVAQIDQQIKNGKIIISMSKRFLIHWVIIRGTSADGKTAYYWDPWDKTPTVRMVGDGWVNPGNVCEVFSIPGK